MKVSPSSKALQEKRKLRLAAALRENLRKRKEQTRQRKNVEEKS